MATTTDTIPATLPEQLFPASLLPYVQHDRMPDGTEWCHVRIYFPPFFPLQYVGPFTSRSQVNRWLKAIDPLIGHTLADLSNTLSFDDGDEDDTTTTTKPALSLVGGAKAKATKKGR